MNYRIDKQHGDRFIYDRTLFNADYSDLCKSLSPKLPAHLVTVSANSFDGYIECTVTVDSRFPTKPVVYRVYEYDSGFIPVSPADYMMALSDNPLNATLSSFNSTDELSGYRCYQYAPNGSRHSEREDCFYAISPAGEITGIVNNGGQEYGKIVTRRVTGFLPIALAHAKQSGGTWLNCWDTETGLAGSLTIGKLASKYYANGLTCYRVEQYDSATYGPPSIELQQAWSLFGEWSPESSYLPCVRYFRV